MIEEILNSQILWAAVGVVIGVPMAGVAVSVGMRVGAKNVRKALDYWYKVDDVVIEAVDDPNDKIIRWLDSIIPGKVDTIFAAAIPAFLRAMADEVEKQAPRQEVNIGGGVN